MRKCLTVSLFLFALTIQESAGQLSGQYTLGGEAADFSSFQDAADSLMGAGIAGPVDILVRPDFYTSPDSSERVLNIHSQIVGATGSDQVTFMPDRASGADRTNVVLRRFSGTREEGFVINVGSSHVTLKEMTVEVSDTAAAVIEIPSVIAVGNFVSEGPPIVESVRIDGLVVDGLFRRSYRCIRFKETSADVSITDNRVRNCVEPIFGQTLRTLERLRVVGNHLTGMYGYQHTPDDAGLYIRGSAGSDIVVSDNVLDYAGGSGLRGIVVIGDNPLPRLRVERNRVVNFDVGDAAYFLRAGEMLRVTNAPDGLIANNFLSGTANDLKGAILETSTGGDTLTFAHNTVRLGGGGEAALTVLRRADLAPSFVRVVNNILLGEGYGDNGYSHMFFSYLEDSEISANIHQWGTGGGYIPGFLDTEAGTSTYVDIADCQEHGQCERSVAKRPDFIDDGSDLHLTECSVTDDELRGISFSDVPFDIDSEVRDAAAPFMGADEPAGAPPPVFDGPTIFPAGNGSFLFDVADIDDDGDLDAVVTNPGSASGGTGDNDVTILLNDGVGNFSEPAHLPFGTDPNDIKIGLINEDHLADLVVRGDDGVLVRFGSGDATFSAPTDLGDFGTSDLELADYDNDGDMDVFVVHNSADSSSVLVHINQGDGTFSEFVDFSSISAEPVSDMVIADIDADGFVDVIAVEAAGAGRLFTLRNLGTQAPGVSRGFDAPVVYPFAAASHPSRSRFVVGDFDGDLDLDVMVGTAAGGDSLVFIRNNGDGTLGQREAFEVHYRGVPETVAALDYEQDGDLDLVVASSESTVDLMLNDGGGSFERVILCDAGALAGFPIAISTGRIDADMSTDVAVLTFPTTGGTVEVLHNLEWTPSGIAVDDPADTVPLDFRLRPNYPNPFSTATNVHYTLPEAALVRLVVYDVVGRRVSTLVDETQRAGDHVVQFHADGLSSGIYFYRLTAGDFRASRSMLIVREK